MGRTVPIEGSYQRPTTFGEVVTLWKGMADMAEAATDLPEPGATLLDPMDMGAMLMALENWLAMHVEHLCKEAKCPPHLIVPMLLKVSGGLHVGYAQSSLREAKKQGAPDAALVNAEHAMLHQYMVAVYCSAVRAGTSRCMEFETMYDCGALGDDAQRDAEGKGPPPDLSA